MKKQFKNQHRTLESFGYEFLVICPHCSKHAKVTSLGEPYPFLKDITKRFLCTYCGVSKDLVPKKNRAKQNIISYGPNYKKEFISIGGAFDWYFGYPLVLQIPCCGKTLWAYNREHLMYLKSYVEAELREHYPYYLSVESMLPNWIKSAKNRKLILKAIAKLEERLFHDT
ncbi:hypothetical protein MK805_08990 [Shimazuella sp. AN120528]|uniref:hypothetical protein n=1 Tax=Shimazuella soli TaxID=1892854 RepID=UPI001F0EC9EE|nr:hypothetical protein [Shimazuella soli]MCH5585105.1 hypothetical protein [Shimazuella soli]